MGGRTPVEEIGVYYSSSSQLAGMCPGGAPDFNDQPHIFAYWGWGTALSRLHYTYRAVPEWKLSPEALSGLRVLIVPEAEVFDPDDVPTLTAWVRGGGLLIVTGQSGRRRGESGNFGVNEEGLALAPLTGVAQMEKASSRLLTPVGRGKVLYLREDIGRAFYKADAERAKMLPAFREALAAVSDKARPFALCGLGETPATVELSVYSDASTRRVFVDVNNVDIDTSNDTVTPTPPLSIDVRLPSWLQGRKLSMHVLSPEGRMFVLVSPVSAEVAGIRLSPIQFYASVLIEEERRR
jgi:hypothetical protein